MRNAHLLHSRGDVLAVAEDLLTREGPPGLSVRRIAEALGVSRQIVYSRFLCKPDLVRALHSEGFRRLIERFEAVTAEPGSTEHLLALGQAYRDSALASPALFALMFGRPIADFEPDDQAREVALEAFVPVLDASRAWLAAHGRDAGEAPALGLARAVWATTHGVVSLETAGLLGADDAPAMIERLLRAVLAAEPAARHDEQSSRAGRA
jgi:AcrR family transcriptional regulator